MILYTGLHTGKVGVTLHVAETGPGLDLDNFEDVVEIDFPALDATLAIETWELGNVTDVGELPAGPGTYRVRYHTQGVDAEHVAISSHEVIDRYSVQIWPAEPSAPKVLKITSTRARNSL